MHRFKTLALACAAGIAALLAGEGLLRLAGRTPATFLFTGSFRDRQSGWDITYGVDRHHRRITAPARGGSPRRFAVLGDSFTFGQGVPDLQDFVSGVNRRLDSWRLDNLGLVGAGIHEYEMVARDLVDRRYSGVLVLFYGNDVSEMPAARSLAGAAAARSSVIALVQRGYRALLVGAAAREGPAPNQIVAALAKSRSYYQQVAEPEPAGRQAFEERFVGLVRLLHDRVGVGKVWVAVAPEGTVVSERLRDFVVAQGGSVAPFGRPGGAYQLVKDLARRTGASFIDTFPAFLADGSRAYHAQDLHWTADGHQRMAALLEASIRDAR